MPFAELFGPSVFVQLALAFYVLGLLTRNEMILRIFLLLGTLNYIVYYMFIGDTPLWDAIFASVAIGVANMTILVAILRERSVFGMSADMKELYSFFPTLYPGQFRKIMACARIIDTTATQLLLTEGETPKHLYLIAHGDVAVQRNGDTAWIGSGNFIGEIAFLMNGTATATVTASPGARIIEWDSPTLKALLRRKPPLDHAFRAMLNTDVARKLSVSWPRPEITKATA